MTFDQLNLNKPLLNALHDLAIQVPTAIQQKSFATIMSGQDVVGIAQTGTGKTFAYLLPLLRLWKFTKSPFPQMLIIVPTRELVAQVVEAAQSLSTYMNVETVGVYGGTNMRSQKANIHAGVDIIVGTPGRLVDLMHDGVLNPKFLKKVVIDEVDEMLNLGFRTQLKNIIDFLPEKRQHLMFSATLTDEVEEVIKQFTNYFEKIEAAPSGAPLDNIKQTAFSLPNFNSKANWLEHLLKADEAMKKVLVFVKTKKMADALFERLLPSFEENLGVIHSSKSQNNRFDTVSKFQDGTYRCLIATDIIARGLDVSGVSHVINFDLPDVAEKYIHRIGRTGRAEQLGLAIAFVTEDDIKFKEAIESLMQIKIEMSPVTEDDIFSDELIPLEIVVEHVPFNNHKIKQANPSGPAFHEKLDKNKKVNKKVRHKELMQKKYGKPKKRGKKR